MLLFGLVLRGLTYTQVPEGEKSYRKPEPNGEREHSHCIWISPLSCHNIVASVPHTPPQYKSFSAGAKNVS